MYTCIQCGYNTKTKCNYIRHLNKKIKCTKNTTFCDPNNNISTQSHSVAVQSNIIPVQSNIIPVQSNSCSIQNNCNPYTIIDDTRIKCNCCEKILTKIKFNRHKTTCKGVPKNTCIYCKKYFNSQQNHSRHQKICKLNPINMEIKVPASTSTTEAPTSNIATQIVNNYYVNNSINNSTVNSTVDNSSTNNNNTVNNNNTITFTSFGRENLEHLTSQVMIDPRLNNIRKCYRDTVDLSHFNADHPENQTVRKTNLKSNLIEFRTHQNKWEYESDKAGFRKIRKNLEEKFKTKFDDVDDMT